MSTATSQPSFLQTRRGKLTLLLLCTVAFVDFVDASIVNVALPSISHALHFSVQSLQWVPSAYLLTYGGFMLLGGRAADLLGRRRVLVAGTVVLAISLLVGGLAGSSGVLVGARLAQGAGAAMMLPAGLSILTTSFKEGKDRYAALGAWGAVGGLASAAGVLLGGLITSGLGRRWVMFVNPIVCVVVLGATFRLISGERPGAAAGLISSERRWRPAGCCCWSTRWSTPRPSAGVRLARSPSSRALRRCWRRSSSTSCGSTIRWRRYRSSRSMASGPPTPRC